MWKQKRILYFEAINPNHSQSINPKVNHGVDESPEIHIYNVLGELVITVGTGLDLSAQIDISSLPKGLYIVKFGNKIAKFVKI